MFHKFYSASHRCQFYLFSRASNDDIVDAYRQLPLNLDLSTLDLQIFELLKKQYWGGTYTPQLVNRVFRESVSILLIGVPDTVAANTAPVLVPILIGCARAVTDRATFAFVCDVAVDEVYRGSGYGALLVKALLGQAELREVSRFHLLSRDAEFWGKFKFTPLTKCNRHFELLREWPKKEIIDESSSTDKRS